MGVRRLRELRGMKRPSFATSDEQSRCEALRGDCGLPRVTVVAWADLVGGDPQSSHKYPLALAQRTRGSAARWLFRGRGMGGLGLAALPEDAGRAEAEPVASVSPGAVPTAGAGFVIAVPGMGVVPGLRRGHGVAAR